MTPIADIEKEYNIIMSKDRIWTKSEIFASFFRHHLEERDARIAALNARLNNPLDGGNWKDPLAWKKIEELEAQTASLHQEIFSLSQGLEVKKAEIAEWKEVAFSEQEARKVLVKECDELEARVKELEAALKAEVRIMKKASIIKLE